MSVDLNFEPATHKSKSLRDEFAIAALGACIQYECTFLQADPTREFEFDMIAADAYGIADAMLEARKQ